MNVALRKPVLPSVTLTSLTRREGSGSSSTIVPSPVSSAIVLPPEALDSLTLKVSLPSDRVSPTICTGITVVVAPAGMVAVPLVAV